MNQHTIEDFELNEPRGTAAKQAKDRSQTMSNLPHPYYDRDKTRMFSGNTGIIVKSINKLKDILGNLQNLKQGGEAKQRFVAQLHGVLSMMDQQLDQAELKLIEARAMHKIRKTVNNVLREAKTNSQSIKLGSFTKNNSTIGIWENENKILIVDGKSKTIRESKMGRANTIAFLENKGWVTESTNILYLFKNEVGNMLKLRAVDQSHKVYEIISSNGSVKRFKTSLQNLISALQNKGYHEVNAETGSLDDASLAPMEDQEPNPEEDEQELMASRHRPRYRFQRQRNKLKY